MMKKSRNVVKRQHWENQSTKYDNQTENWKDIHNKSIRRMQKTPHKNEIKIWSREEKTPKAKIPLKENQHK